MRALLVALAVAGCGSDVSASDTAPTLELMRFAGTSSVLFVLVDGAPWLLDLDTDTWTRPDWAGCQVNEVSPVFSPDGTRVHCAVEGQGRTGSGATGPVNGPLEPAPAGRFADRTHVYGFHSDGHLFLVETDGCLQSEGFQVDCARRVGDRWVPHSCPPSGARQITALPATDPDGGFLVESACGAPSSDLVWLEDGEWTLWSGTDWGGFQPDPGPGLVMVRRNTHPDSVVRLTPGGSLEVLSELPSGALAAPGGTHHIVIDGGALCRSDGRCWPLPGA